MRVRSHARTGATTLVAFGMVAAGLVGASSAHAASVETTVSSLNAGAETSPEPEGVMTLPENTMTEDPPSADEDITLEDVQAMFPDKVGDPDIVAEGLPSLNQAMQAADITTPERKAAFLATIAHESLFEYNIREQGDTRPYGGRGYIQLTGDFNYGPARAYLGIDLLGNPDLAMSLEGSAPLARWYWTVARDINPLADQLDMGAVNAAIGYPAGEEDNRRCASFESALEYLTGSVPPGINCTRPAGLAGDTRDLTREQWEDRISD